jgi:hypothetical protein
VVVTDAPLLHSAIYCEESNHTFKKLILEEFNKFHNINYYIGRRKDYNPNGRTQTYDQALVVDGKILDYLKHNKVSFNTVVGTIDAVDSIINDVVETVKIMVQEEEPNKYEIK